MIKFFSIQIFFLLISVTIFAENNDIKKQEKALQKIRQEIDAYEQRIQESEKKEKVTLEHLDNIEKQSNLIKSFIGQMTAEVVELREDIGNTKETIQQIEQQLASLQQHYANYVNSIYKFGRTYDVETLLSSKSINQLYIRIEYFKKFSGQRKKDLNYIEEKRKALEEQHNILQAKLNAEQNILKDKKNEEDVLQDKKIKREKVLSNIRQDKTEYQKELSRKIEAAKDLENLIATLIEQERIRKEREAKLERERKAKLERERKERLERERKEQEKREKELKQLKAAKQKDKIKAKEREIELAKKKALEDEKKFEELSIATSPTATLKKGQLPWPVSSGKIVAQFGEQVHPILKTVTQNTGIDISVPTGTSIKAVADGEVALIHWLPSYGNLVILNHSNGYRTVYAHLSDIAVNVGQEITAGEEIAKSGDSVSGSLLHFEVWKEKEKQNPEVWLKKQR